MTSPRRSSSPATDVAFALLDRFVALGVRDVVLSPGSRSQALALAVATLEAEGGIRLRVRLDERSAGFLALGLAVETAAPVLVITTSGSAVANLHPAVIEAHHSAVPLILLTADRPVELRGVAANQTTHQPGIFGRATAFALDVPAPSGAEGETDAAAALAGEAYAAAARGPVHLNLQFREPLSGAAPVRPAPAPAPANVSVCRESSALSPEHSATGATKRDRSVAEVGYSRHTVVVAGAGAGPEAEELAHGLGAPLLAEVSSGARFGPNLVVDYRRLLGDPQFGGAIERVIVFGHPTLSREVPALVQRDGVETVVVRSGPEDWNPGRRVTRHVDALRVEGSPDPESRAWVGRWVQASREALERQTAPDVELALSNAPRDQAAFNRAVIADLRAPVSRRDLVEAVWRLTWPHDRLVLGASRLIREADKVVPGKRITVHANRGLAGIDGTVATGLGVALASQASAGAGANGITRVLLGDLALLHDAGSLLFGEGESRPRIQVIVGNDAGGTIFDGLEVASTADAAAFERVMLTPQRASFAALAEAYGWEYRRAATRGELEEALAPGAEPRLIEVPLAR